MGTIHEKSNTFYGERVCGEVTTVFSPQLDQRIDFGVETQDYAKTNIYRFSSLCC